MAALFREVRLRFAQHELKAPHYRTVRQRVKELSPRLVVQKREGAKSARAKHGPVRASTLRADLPLDVVQIDHTPADVIVVDQENRRPVGRPCLSLAIDVVSRVVMGFQVSSAALDAGGFARPDARGAPEGGVAGGSRAADSRLAGMRTAEPGPPRQREGVSLRGLRSSVRGTRHRS